MNNIDKKPTASNETIISKKRVPIIISLLIIITSLFAIIISLHFKKQESNLVTDDNETYLKPSEETLEIAKTAVYKLYQSVVFLPGVVEKTLYEIYNDTAKWVAPELLTLETKQDASIALIKIYEDILKEYKNSDLDSYNDFQKKDFEYAQQHSPYPIAQTILSDEHKRIHEIEGTRMVLEALLALDIYYDQLDKDTVERMMNDFEEYARISSTSLSKFYDDVSTETMFEMYRNGFYEIHFIYP